MKAGFLIWNGVLQQAALCHLQRTRRNQIQGRTMMSERASEVASDGFSLCKISCLLLHLVLTRSYRILLAFASYFGIGAYYNYSTYGATGMDLIPHRDFWREVPYMLRDVFDHLCTSVKPRSSGSRGGYIAV